MKVKVYISGPYSQGNTNENTYHAIVVGEAIADMGASPFIPHLSHFRPRTRSYEYWIQEDLEWLSCCQALYRMPGESPGADREVEYANESGIPVFYSLNELEEFINKV